MVSDYDFSHFWENWLQRHLVPVLSGQKFSSGLFQYGSIVSKTCSKSQGKLIDSFFFVQMRSEFYSKYWFPKTAKGALLILGNFMLSHLFKIPPMKVDLFGGSCFNYNQLVLFLGTWWNSTWLESSIGGKYSSVKMLTFVCLCMK